MSRGAHANDISDHLIELSPNLIPNVAFCPDPRLVYGLLIFSKTAFGMIRGAHANDIFEHSVELSSNETKPPHTTKTKARREGPKPTPNANQH